jgi:hypothetical protein
MNIIRCVIHRRILLLLQELDSRASAAIWSSLLVTFIILLIKPNASSMRMLFIASILRSIYSVGLGPTLWLMGAIQVGNTRTTVDIDSYVLLFDISRY